MLDEHLDVDFFAAAQVQGEAGVVVAIEEAHACGLDRRDEDGDGAGGELPQGGGALLLHIGVRREIFERKHIVRGQAHDAVGIEGAGEFAAGAQRGLERFGGLVVGDEHDDRLLGRPGQEGKVKGARGDGQSGHTSAPRSEAEMPANALKGGGVLQVREKFADEREDHRGLV